MFVKFRRFECHHIIIISKGPGDTAPRNGPLIVIGKLFTNNLFFRTWVESVSVSASRFHLPVLPANLLCLLNKPDPIVFQHFRLVVSDIS
jgi:hypothetical protein